MATASVVDPSRANPKAMISSPPTNKFSIVKQVLNVLNLNKTKINVKEKYFSTITDAILAAQPNEYIIISPGEYCETLNINKPVELIGMGSVTVTCDNGRAIVSSFAATGGIRNIKFEQKKDDMPCVCIWSGQIKIVGCDITSKSRICLSVNGVASSPRLIRNKIHSGAQFGVTFCQNSSGIMQYNEVYDNGHSGIVIQSSSNPSITHNKVYRNKKAGVQVRFIIISHDGLLQNHHYKVCDSGRGVLEENQIYENDSAGVAVTGVGNPLVRKNTISNGKNCGVYVHSGG
eukprot:TRINITY_DN3442_c0_g1_i1.p1 TRINITY_DN3442_c0_g1~~TRINITY_DN3442_c0_g1_i1.p1  ORF type:complete len:289 (-),score=46.80 TRINITY_DN3442_c0_g1_i1:731-1597(-)